MASTRGGPAAHGRAVLRPGAQVGAVGSPERHNARCLREALRRQEKVRPFPWPVPVRRARVLSIGVSHGREACTGKAAFDDLADGPRRAAHRLPRRGERDLRGGLGGRGLVEDLSLLRQGGEAELRADVGYPLPLQRLRALSAPCDAAASPVR